MPSNNSDFSGFDDILKTVNKLDKAARRLSRSQVPADELFTPQFMRKHTRYRSFAELLEAAGFAVASSRDFEAISESDLDREIRRLTRFSSWSDFIGRATEEYLFK